MAKQYFSHDFGARTDPKMLNLRKDYGVAGVGAYWCIVENLFENCGYLDETEICGVSYDLRIEDKMLEDILTKYNLFDFENGRYFSSGVLKRLNIAQEKREKAIKSAEARWGKNNANAMQSESDRNATVMQTQCDRNANAMQSESDRNAIKLNYIKVYDDKEYIIKTGCEGARVREDVRDRLINRLSKDCESFFGIVKSVYGDASVFSSVIEIIAVSAAFSDVITFGGTNSLVKTINPNDLKWAIDNHLITPHNIAHITGCMYEKSESGFLEKKITDPVAYVLTALLDLLSSNEEWLERVGGKDE